MDSEQSSTLSSKQSTKQSAVSVETLNRLAVEQVPLAGQLGLTVDAIAPGECTVRVPYRGIFVRPGGTIAGPVMMALADFAMWGAVMSHIGEVHLAVTSNLNINFLKRPKPGDVVAQATVLKVGKRLAVGEVYMRGEDDQGLVAHATVTYSIPPPAD